MKRTKVLAVLMLLCITADGRSGDLSLNRSTLDNGGGESAGDDLTLTATIAQPDAALMTGGAFTLTAGFWARGGSDLLFKDGYE